MAAPTTLGPEVRAALEALMREAVKRDPPFNELMGMLTVKRGRQVPETIHFACDVGGQDSTVMTVARHKHKTISIVDIIVLERFP